MAQHILTILTNLGKQRPWREGILEAPPLQIDINGVAMDNLVSYCTVQDLRLSSYNNVNTTRKYERELPNLILGKSESWKLWKAVVMSKTLEFHYINLDDQHKQNFRKCSVLLCQMLWPDGIELKISADTKFGEWSNIPSAYTINFDTSDNEVKKRRTETLKVRYRFLNEVHKDTYTTVKPLQV